MKTVGTKLDNSEYEIFEFCCNENGLTKSEQLRDLIKTFVNDNDGEVIQLDLDEEEVVAEPVSRLSDRIGDPVSTCRAEHKLIHGGWFLCSQ